MFSADVHLYRSVMGLVWLLVAPTSTANAMSSAALPSSTPTATPIAPSSVVAIAGDASCTASWWESPYRIPPLTLTAYNVIISPTPVSGPDTHSIPGTNATYGVPPCADAWTDVLLNGLSYTLSVSAQYTEDGTGTQFTSSAAVSAPFVPTAAPPSDSNSNYTTSDAVLDTCGLHLVPIALVVGPLCVDIVTLVVLGADPSRTRWYHWLLYVKCAVSTWMSTVALIELWGRRLSGGAFMGCTIVFESQAGLLVKFCSMTAFSVKVDFRDPFPGCVAGLAMAGGILTFLPQLCIMTAALAVTVWPFVWLVSVVLPLLWCLRQCVWYRVANVNGYVDFLKANDPRATTTDEKSMEFTLGFQTMAAVFGIGSLVSLMGAALYGWGGMTPQNYWNALALLDRDRPSLIGWTLQQYQSLIGMV